MGYSLRTIEADAQTPQRPTRPLVGSRFVTSTNQCKGGILSHRVHAGLIDLLAGRYPATRRLAGELSFRVVARRFILNAPSTTPILDRFGDNFPRFIRKLGEAACIEYVADLAELEMLRWTVRCAPHAEPLPRLDLASLPAERLKKLGVALHPSVCLVQSRFPIVTAWENNRSSDDSGMIERWAPEAALVAKPLLVPEVTRLPPGGYCFLRALSEGRAVAAAVRIAMASTPTFDTIANLKLIEQAKIVVAIQESVQP